MKKITYLLLIIVFFNLLTLLFYYLKLIDSYGFKFSENIVINASISNFVIIISNIVYMAIYNKYLISKFNYFITVIFGFII